MNILFVLKTVDMGGVEIVTSVLANKFVAEGHRVSVFYFYEGNSSVANLFDKRVEFYKGHGYLVSKENVTLLRRILVDDKIEVIINQWGLPLVPIRTIMNAAKGLAIKIISVYHNTPDMNGRIMAANMKIANSNNPIATLIFKMERFVVTKVTSWSMRYNYYNSDCYMVLSPSFIDKFKRFTGIENPTKLVVQPNPITIEEPSDNQKDNQKVILYVGRLDNIQKRIDRIIDVWTEIEPNHNDWKLIIVGDGDARNELQTMVNQRNLRNVQFVGFQNPLEYYKRASIILLTSEFEGFGLVVVEAMTYGVVPIVYGSYSAIYDIITNNKDGVIVSPTKQNRFDRLSFKQELERLIKCPETLGFMSSNAITSSKRFSLSHTYDSWRDYIVNINKEGL